MNCPAGELTISEGIEHKFTVEEMDDETYTGLIMYKWVKLYLAQISIVLTGPGGTTVNFQLQLARTDGGHNVWWTLNSGLSCL